MSTTPSQFWWPGGSSRRDGLLATGSPRWQHGPPGARQGQSSGTWRSSEDLAAVLVRRARPRARRVAPRAGCFGDTAVLKSCRRAKDTQLWAGRQGTSLRGQGVANGVTARRQNYRDAFSWVRVGNAPIWELPVIQLSLPAPLLPATSHLLFRLHTALQKSVNSSGHCLAPFPTRSAAPCRGLSFP